MTTPRAHRGFTLIEAITVIVIAGILAASAVPAFSVLAESRRHGAAAEIARRLTTARDAAVGTGRPTGLRYTHDTGSFMLIEIASTGAAPTPALGPLGTPDGGVAIPEQFAGVTVTAVQRGDGTTGDGDTWFSSTGVPHTRSTVGNYISDWTSDGTITLTGGVVVHIRAHSGLIER